MSKVTCESKRRDILRQAGCAAVLAAGICAPVFAQARSLRIAASVATSGSESPVGAAMLEGSNACINAINQAGGVHGAKIELVAMDDQFNPDLARQNALAFQADSRVLAILHPLGTRQAAAMMQAAPDLAIVGPNTGTVALRKMSAPNTFWVRASYEQELDKLVSTCITLGHAKFGFVHPKDPFGAGLLAAFEAVCGTYKVKPHVIATTASTTSMEVDPAARDIAEARPEVVVVGLTSGSSHLFLRSLRKAGYGGRAYGLSISINAQNMRQLGELGRGFGVSIILPSPFATKYELVRRYQADMRASGLRDFSLASMEGYVDAKVLAEGLRRAGPSPGRAAIVNALEQIVALDLGGVRLEYGKGIREGGSFVDVAVIGGDGRLLS